MTHRLIRWFLSKFLNQEIRGIWTKSLARFLRWWSSFCLETRSGPPLPSAVTCERLRMRLHFWLGSVTSTPSLLDPHTVLPSSCAGIWHCDSVLPPSDLLISLPGNPAPSPSAWVVVLSPLPPQLVSGCLQVFRSSQSHRTSPQIALYILMEFYLSHTTR